MFSIFGAGSFLEAFSTLKHKKIDEVCLNSYVLYCFPNFLCIVLFCVFQVMYFIVLWFPLFEIFIWINIKLNSCYTKQKEDKVTDLFWYTKWKNLTFRVDLWSQKVMWLRNGRSDFRKLSVKICVRLQKKESWSGAPESAAKFVGGGGDSEPPPPPPTQCS